jgi:hypothetical protein
MKRVILTVLVIAGTVFLLGAQEETSTTVERFIQELQNSLQERGWSEAELEAFADAARELDWEGSIGANAEIVARTLQYAKNRGDSAPEDSEAAEGAEESEAAERARIALENAITAREMERAGFDDREIARTALESTREMLGVIEEWHRGGREGNLGEQLRERVAEEVRERARNHAEEELQNRGRSRGRHGRGAAGDIEPPAAPGNPDGPNAPNNPESPETPDTPGDD